jgi:transposase
MNEQLIKERIQDKYNDSLNDGVTSEALSYAIDEHPEILLEILKAKDPEEILELVAEWKQKTYEMFEKENWDSVDFFEEG